MFLVIPLMYFMYIKINLSFSFLTALDFAQYSVIPKNPLASLQLILIYF